jgi:PAS domain S-box-containing protein
MKADLLTHIPYEGLQNTTALDTEAAKSIYDMAWLDDLPVKIIIADALGKAEHWNKQWYEYTGLPLDYPKNKLLKAALHPDDIRRTYNGILYSVRTGKELQIEYRLKRAADGQYRWHLARAYPIKNAEQKIMKWLVAVTDIHEQKQAECNKDMFLGVVSHELKTPLTTLKTLLHLYKSEIIGDNDAYPNVLEQAENQLLRMERLVGNLLDVSKANAYKMVYRFEEFNFGEMVKECIEHMQQQTVTHTIVLEQNVKVLFTGDKLRLEQVINNLLSNAIKYSPGADTIIVKSYIVQDEVYVSVQDFGIGIAPENINDIYTAYYRVSNTAAAFEGLGIGLYICSEIIKSHLGKLWAQSVPAQGSTFYFSLPING